MFERRLTSILHSRATTLLTFVLAIVMTVVAFNDGEVIEFGGNRGFVFPSANVWFASKGLSLAVSLLLTFVPAILATTILKTFNPIKGLSSLWGSMFIIIECALPSVACQFYGGTLLVCVAIAVMLLLFSCYDNPDARRVFLTFLIVGLASTVQYGFLFLFPLMLLGLQQMRIFTLRTALAATMGLVAPYWVIYGCGIRSFGDLEWPVFASIFSSLEPSEMLRVATIVIFTMVSGLSFLIANLVKVLSYNAQVRAYNGFIAILQIASVLLIFIDFNNHMFYIPLLNLTTAYQICFFFSIRRFKRSYVPILLLFMMYITFYLWSVAI